MAALAEGERLRTNVGLDIRQRYSPSKLWYEWRASNRLRVLALLAALFLRPDCDAGPHHEDKPCSIERPLCFGIAGGKEMRVDRRQAVKSGRFGNVLATRKPGGHNRATPDAYHRARAVMKSR
jgi:hypothetical protein